MQTVFLELVKLSLIGSLFAAAVMLVRLIFRKAPKWLFCVLWGVVALRLICPVSIESNISLVPDRLASGQIITNVGNEYIGDVDIIYESNIGYSNAIEAGRQPIYSGDGYYVVTEKDSLEAPKTVGETIYPILSWIWVAGVVLMLAYTAGSYFLLRKKMEEATHLRDNIWQCEQVDSPFVLGFIKPRIYLPYAITDSDMANVIAHEQAHIQRKDHWWKPIGFLLLSIHWFNPVLWLAYILLCRDIEAACDEKVIKHMEKDEMRAYSTALLHCSVHRRRIAACPLAFGETGVKERIKRVMNYRKPAFWVILLALIASAVACVLLLTNPSAKNTTLMGANYRVTDVLYSTASEDDDRYSRFLITADYVLYAQLEGDDSWCIHEKMEAYPLTAKELQEYTTNKNGWKENYRIQDITDAYICRKENDWFYLAAQTKNGDTLIGVGWEDVSERGQGASDDTYLRYLYKVESEFTENEFNVNFFVHSLYEALGVTDCFEAYTNEDNPGFIVVGFMSDYNDQAEHDYNDMGFAVFQSQNNGYRLLDYHVYENAANQNEGIVFCDHPAVMSLDGSMDHNVTFDVIISCNTKLDKIQREYYKDDKLSKQIASTHLGGGKSMTLFRWDEMVGSNLRIKQYYLDSEGNEIAFEEYGEAVNNDNLIAMVQNIAHNPDCAASSNPFVFIEAKRPLYNEILTYGSKAVDCFVEQIRAGENGLQGYIMAVACADITGIGDKDLGADWGTAQEWLALYDKSDKNTIIPPVIATDYISGKQAQLLSFGYSSDKKGQSVIACGIAPYQGDYSDNNTLVLDGESGQNQILLTPKGASFSQYRIYLPDGTVYDEGTRTAYDSLSLRVMNSDKGICLIAPFHTGEFIYEIALTWPEQGLTVIYGLKIVMTGKESDYDRALESVFAKYGGDNPLISVSLVDQYVLANAVYSSKRYVFRIENVPDAPIWVEVAGESAEITGEFKHYDVLPPYVDPPWGNFDSGPLETINGNMKTYYKNTDGTWQVDGRNYQYRLVITGRMNNAAVDSTFVYLSNLESITFDQAWKAAGLSSNKDDYFDAEDAVLVEWLSGGNKAMTLTDVVELSKLGMELTWEDLKAYKGEEIGSGLHTVMFNIDPEFSLLAAGGETTGGPMYVSLNAVSNGASCDIREGDVETFIKENQSDALDYAIHKAVIEHNADGTFPDFPNGFIPTQVHYIYGIETKSGTPVVGQLNHMEETTVYVHYVYSRYLYTNGELTKAAGNATPAKLTFSVDPEKGYTLKEFWEPNGGSVYAEEIRANFPKEIADIVLDPQSDLVDTEKMEHACLVKVQEYISSLTD